MSNTPRIVIMLGTRDWYHRMVLSLKSLCLHTRVDHVYFLIEDDAFPEPLPDLVSCVNVSHYPYFPESGPNYHSNFSHMILYRTALPIMFPDVDIALSIDADTITNGDIGPIWDTDLSNHYLAAVQKCYHIHGKTYYNAGVMLMNFANLRRDQVPEQTMRLLNQKYYRYKEQDLLNDFCRNRIVALPTDYNSAYGITGYLAHQPLITHYIGCKPEKDRMLRDAAQFESLSWDDIIKKEE